MNSNYIFMVGIRIEIFNILKLYSSNNILMNSCFTAKSKIRQERYQIKRSLLDVLWFIPIYFNTLNAGSQTFKMFFNESIIKILSIKVSNRIHFYQH